MPSPLRLHLALFFVALMFSANYVIAKVAMREFSPVVFAWLRMACAGVVLSLFARARNERLEAGDYGRLALYALLGVVINGTLFLAGLNFTTVQVAAVLITTGPVFALGAAIALGAERASAAKIGGLALAGAGALLVVGGEGIEGTTRSLLGAVMIVVNCFSFAIYLVISKPTMARLSPQFVVGRMFAFGALMLFPIAAVPLARENWTTITPGAWLALAVVIAGPTILGYLLNAWALQHSDSSFVAIYTYVQPVLATLLGALFLGETIHGRVVAAAVLIFTGVFISGRAAQTGPIAD